MFSTSLPSLREFVTVRQRAGADRVQRAMVRQAVDDLLRQYARDGDPLGAALWAWTARLADSADPARLFTAPARFPVIPLPWWVEGSCRSEVERDFQQDLIRSTVAGYWFIRLIDGVMDGHLARPALVASAGSLYHEFEAPYRQWFPPAHPFWHHFRQAWAEAATAAFREAESSGPVDDAGFLAVAACKSAASKIPVAAALWRVDRSELLPDWMTVCDLLGAHEQMLDDLMDWQRDRDAGRATRLLSEARSRAGGPGGEVAWIVSDGVDWACLRMAAWRDRLAELAACLKSPDLLAFLDRRDSQLSAWSEQWRPGLTALAAVARGFPVRDVPSPVSEIVP